MRVTCDSRPCDTSRVALAEVAAGALVGRVLHRQVVRRGQVGVAVVVREEEALWLRALPRRRPLLHYAKHLHVDACAQQQKLLRANSSLVKQHLACQKLKKRRVNHLGRNLRHMIR